jgi:pre-rRNA-processing protein IPI1
LFLSEDALMGIKDLFRKHPAELRLHKYAVVEKLRERIGDEDKVVRETLYQLFKSVIFPTYKEVILFSFLKIIVVFIVAHHQLSIFVTFVSLFFLSRIIKNFSFP